MILFVVASQWVSATEVSTNERSVPLPPKAIAQWYKPQNKRQVWLHNMFKLRRELQAVSEYLAIGNTELLQKWMGRFAKHYRQIGEMVPEWQDELELGWLSRLESAVVEGDAESAARAVKRLKRSCGGCHKEYQAVTALLYRTPDFSSIAVKTDVGKVDYPQYMGQLSTLVNRIKIASEDLQKQVALESVQQLRSQLHELTPSCQQCHREDDPKPVERILGEDIKDALLRLEAHIEDGNVKQTGRALGGVAVSVCARCHSVHRTVSAARTMIKGSKE